MNGLTMSKHHNTRWRLDSDEAAAVEAEARKILRLGDTDVHAVAMSVARLAEENELLRLALQPGARKTIAGREYVLNENHRWTRVKQQGGPQQKRRRAQPATAARTRQPRAQAAQATQATQATKATQAKQAQLHIKKANAASHQEV